MILKEIIFYEKIIFLFPIFLSLKQVFSHFLHYKGVISIHYEKTSSWSKTKRA